MQAETYSHLLMKELMALAAGLPTQDREDIAAGGFASYPLCQRHTSWKWGSLHGRTGRRAGRGAYLLILRVGRYA
jgi:hypothetical protein